MARNLAVGAPRVLSPSPHEQDARLFSTRSGTPTRVRELPERADPALHRPPPDPRGHEPAGLRDAARARARRCAFPERTFATVDHIIPTDSQARPLARRARRGDDAARSSATAREHGIRFFDPDERPPGHRARDRPRARPHPAGHDDRLRRQPHLHARRLRRDRLRHRHQPGARRARHAVPRDGAPEGAPHRGERASSRRRLRQGRDPAHHPPARREGRHRLRLRVRRRGDRRA